MVAKVAEFWPTLLLKKKKKRCTVFLPQGESKRMHLLTANLAAFMRVIVIATNLKYTAVLKIRPGF